MNTPGWRSPPSYSGMYTYGTSPAIRGATALRTAAMCLPPPLRPARGDQRVDDSRDARRRPRRVDDSRRAGRPRTPPTVLTSSAASCAHSSEEGP